MKQRSPLLDERSRGRVEPIRGREHFSIRVRDERILVRDE